MYWHYPHYGNQGSAPTGAIREGDWKLVEWYENDKLELFNLKNDPAETKNHAGAQPAKAKALREKLDAWRKETDAKAPTKNPDWRPRKK